uniref:Protein ECT2-like n=1 Tax=Phallusia mammillata TaxID=59560 RepID=A0A6F9DC82_9ASCI|nr:protein ECT2-like [Phallusia mammillata]
MICKIFIFLLAVAWIEAYPFHASCQIEWNFHTLPCDTVHQKLVAQIKKWEGPTGCDSGGEKCLYNLTSNTADELYATHSTPKKHYLDKIHIKFYPQKMMNDFSSFGNVHQFEKVVTDSHGCKVEAFSSSKLFYALLDFGTNYCNLHNLIMGCSFQAQDYDEVTDDSVCTQYSSADCTKY